MRRNDIHAMLNALKRSRKLTTQDIGDGAGINRSHVSRLLAPHRTRTWRVDTLERIADAMGADVVITLVPRDGEPTDATHVDNAQQHAMTRAHIMAQTPAPLQYMPPRRPDLANKAQPIDTGTQAITRRGRPRAAPVQEQAPTPQPAPQQAKRKPLFDYPTPKPPEPKDPHDMTPDELRRALRKHQEMFKGPQTVAEDLIDIARQ